MEIGLILAVSLLTLVAFVGGSLDDVKKMIHSTDALTSAAVGTEASLVKCTLQGTARLPAFSMDGDFVIGGAFFIHYQMHTVVNNYTTKPELPRCTGSFNARDLRFSRTMIFAIEEINNITKLLPGVRIGYQIYDTCSAVPVAVHVAFQLLNGQDPVFYKGSKCYQSGVVMAAVGDSGSTPSISMSRILGSFNIPLVSHFATCACLSDKHEYPTFFRTIPSDYYQAAALAKLVKNFGWTWIGAIHSDSDYGNYGIATFLETAHQEGICVEYIESFDWTHPQSKIRRVADIIRRFQCHLLMNFV